MRSKILIILIIGLLIYINADAQQPGISPQRKVADSLLAIQNYSSALPKFEELLIKYPKDSYYNYALGVCYLYSTRNIEKAISLLKKASLGDVPNLVYFYIAEGYRLSYRFIDAIDYYRRFTINGGSDKIKTQEVEQLVNVCENGSFLLKYVYSPPVIDKKMVARNEFYKYFLLQNINGRLLPKPGDLKTSADKKMGEKSVIFYPNNLAPGDYIYFSGYGNTSQYGKDIFRIKYLEDGYWSKPENLGDAINSLFDEDYPFMSTDGYLYFASKGHYSMGGYDIYRSSYDAQSKKWSNPENIGFPFNSTFDDILYIPRINDSLACFATNRNTAADSLDIVLVKMEKNPIRRSYSSVDEVLKIVKLNPGKQIEQQSIQVVESKKSSTGEIDNTKNKLAAITKNPSFSTIENDPEYMRTIAKGFSEQSKADSLRTKLEKLRSGFDNITTAEARKKLEAEVVKVEDALLMAQNLADNMFARASQIEQEYLTGKRKQEGPEVSTFATDKPEYLYQAQFASTVFRSDEINKLSQIEKTQPQIDKIRDEIQNLKNNLTACIKNTSGSKTDSCLKIQNEMFGKMNVYSNLVKQLYDSKYKIYSDCILVALIKSGNNNIDDAKAEMGRANTHFRASNTILNNLTDEGRVEGLFEASLLNEIGILRLEIAFSRIWGMTLFEQQATSKVIKLERLAFGSPLPQVVEKSQKEVKKEIFVDKKEGVRITRTQADELVQPIIFKPDEPLPFQVLEVSPYSAQNPIPLDEPYPSGVYYKIQLAAFSNPVDFSYFKGMIPVSGERAGGKVIKYYVGKFKTFADADKSLSIVKSKGFKDAFIVSWLDGKPIPVTRAQTMEDKQVKVNYPITISQDSTSLTSTIYIIQIGKYSGKLPDEISQTIKALAPGKDIIRKPDNQGRYIYSISSYSNIDEANRVKDNLLASGINSVTVVGVEVSKK